MGVWGGGEKPEQTKIELSQSVPASDAKNTVTKAMDASDFFQMGLKIFKLHKKEKKDKNNKQYFIEAKEHFLSCSTLAASKSLLGGERTNEYLLLHGRALMCCMSICDFMDDLLSALEYGIRAKDIFNLINNNESRIYFYQCLNNMQTVLLLLHSKNEDVKKGYYLQLSIDHTNEMITLLMKGGIQMFSALGLGKDRSEWNKFLKKLNDTLNSLKLVQGRTMSIVLSNPKSNMTIVDFVPLSV